MGGVRVEEPAAVGAEQLDDFLACDRAPGNCLLPADKRVGDLVVQREVLDDATGDEDDRRNHSERQQDSDGATNQVHPEVAELAGVSAGQAPNERHGDGHADRGRDEVLYGQTRHLYQVALGRLTGVGLPVGVRYEADRGVPRESRCHRGAGVVEVQRQSALDELEDEQEQDADRREGEHAAGIGAPRLFGFRVGADHAIDDLFAARVLLAGVDPVHVVAERHVHGHQSDDHRCEEQDPRGCGTH